MSIGRIPAASQPRNSLLSHEEGADAVPVKGVCVSKKPREGVSEAVYVYVFLFWDNWNARCWIKGETEIAIVFGYCLWTGQELGWYRNGQYPAGLTNTQGSHTRVYKSSRRCLVALLTSEQQLPQRNKMKTGSRGLGAGSNIDRVGPCSGACL